MADRIKVQGIPAFDGEYPLDLEDPPLNALEWRWIKKTSGYLPLTITDGLAGGDPDVVIALAVVAMCRAGKITRDQVLQTAEQLADLPFDDAHLDLIAGEPDPPMGRQTGDQPPNANDSNGFSGNGSSVTSETQETNPSPTGLPGSLKSVASDQATSAT